MQINNETFNNQVGLLTKKNTSNKIENSYITEDKLFTKLNVSESTDYEKFKFLPENRPVSPSLVARIIASMEKEILFDYILVTEDSPALKPGELGVIDGQHRLHARMYLKLPIYYVIVKDYNVRLIIGKNTHKAWKEIDFINCYAKMGDENYNKILSLKEKYPEFKHTRLYVNLALNKFYGGTCNTDTCIKDGTFKIDNWDATIETCDRLMDFIFLKDMKNPAWGQYNFFLSLLKIFKLGKTYDHNNLIRKMQIYANQLTRCITQDMYLRNISQIYNFNTPKNKLKHFDLECRI